MVKIACLGSRWAGHNVQVSVDEAELPHDMKRCTTCREVKARTDFPKNANAKDGLGSQCKTCKAARSKIYRKENAEKRRAYNKAWAKANPDKAIANKQAWRERNREKVNAQAKALRDADPEKHRAAQRRYRENNPEKVKETRKKHLQTEKARETKQAWMEANPEKAKSYYTKYRANNPDKVAASRKRSYERNRDILLAKRRAYAKANPEMIRRNSNRRKARKRGNGVFHITKRELRRIYSSPCVACGATENITADHIIPLSRNGRDSIGNLQSLCYSCNSSKHNQLMVEWRAKKARLARQDEAA